ncbi:leucine-rich repeat-containing protein 45 isoform X5 [Corvus moneduloides]|uniref:leucine-rich repeat-containing protein 45 isoform X5 n=1 Tax=Corvus moneduloides TaxID=1196302 RepID=UPI0013625DC1|nr:leucine-rich repeat-containing protein 45 isoform X5 [Corvus moneduloides]
MSGAALAARASAPRPERPHLPEAAGAAVPLLHVPRTAGPASRRRAAGGNPRGQGAVPAGTRAAREQFRRERARPGSSSGGNPRGHGAVRARIRAALRGGRRGPAGGRAAAPAGAQRGAGPPGPGGAEPLAADVQRAGPAAARRRALRRAGARRLRLERGRCKTSVAWSLLQHHSKIFGSEDLRWNNIGLLGGRALLNCLHSNKTLKRLELAGNNVPGDILKAVEQALNHNQDREAILSEAQNQMNILSKEVLSLKDEKNKQFMDFVDAVDKHKEEKARSEKMSVARISQLQDALDEQYSIMNSLKTKLQMTEAALALSEQKVHNLGELLNAMKQEQNCVAECHFRELQQQKQEGADREGRLLHDLSAASEKNLLLRNQVDELERKCKVQQDQLFQVKQDLTNTTAELKLRAVEAEERLETEKRRFKQSLEDMESLRVKEVDRMTQHMEASERSMHNRIQRLEAIRISLEEELSQVKAAALTERGQAEEELIKVRSQARLEEQQRLEHLKEKLRLMTESRDEAQNCCLKQKEMVAEAQAKAKQLSLYADGLRRRLDELQQDLDSKEEEKVTELNKVKVELQEQIGHLEAERAAQDGLREKIAALERQLKALSSNHREALLDKEGEISLLLEKLRMKEAEISRVREEEVQRASFLQNAIMAYVQGSPLGTHSSRK